MCCSKTQCDSCLSTRLAKLATERLLLQSLSLSHREFSPVRQYEGVRVSVEYIEGRNGGHSSHLHCYRAQQRGQHHTYQATHTGQPALGVICTSLIPVKPWMCPSLQQTPQLVSANQFHAKKQTVSRNSTYVNKICLKFENSW